MGGTGVGISVNVADGGNVGSGSVGIKVGNTKTDTGSPLTRNVPTKVPKTANMRASGITHLLRAILTPIHTKLHCSRTPHFNPVTNIAQIRVQSS